MACQRGRRDGRSPQRGLRRSNELKDGPAGPALHCVLREAGPAFRAAVVKNGSAGARFRVGRDYRPAHRAGPRRELVEGLPASTTLQIALLDRGAAARTGERASVSHENRPASSAPVDSGVDGLATHRAGGRVRGRDLAHRRGRDWLDVIARGSVLPSLDGEGTSTVWAVADTGQAYRVEHLSAAAPDVFRALLDPPHADLADLWFYLWASYLYAGPFLSGAGRPFPIAPPHEDDLFDEIPNAGTGQEDTKG
jgi:hypothetical protein